MNRSSFRLTGVVLTMVAALAVYACGDSTGPSIHRGPRATVAVNPVFQSALAADVVEFERVRIILHRADGSVALDTLIDFPAGADEVTLTLNVPLSPSAPAAGEDFSLDLEMLNAAGEVVFRGGPINVRASQGEPPPPVDIPTTYTGPGASAIRVEISPSSRSVIPGATADFTATAFDEGGSVVANAPIQFSSTNPATATIANPAVGRAVAGTARGTTQIKALLVNGASAEATLSVRPNPVAIAADGGGGQTGAVGAALALPLSAKVTATDGLGVDGVVVTFAVAAGGGTLSTGSATTNADGVASTNLTLGSVPGPVTVTATAAGLTGSPVVFNASGVAGGATQFAFAVQPVGGIDGINLQPIVVNARDSFGNLATSYIGLVTLALDAPPQGIALAGTVSVNAVGGVATFSAVRVTGVASGLRLRATGVGVAAGINSDPFTVSPSAATKITITTQAAGQQRLGRPVRLVAAAQNAAGQTVPSHQGTVKALVLAGPPGATILSGGTAAFVNGVATLDVLTSHPGQYQLILDATGLTFAIGTPYTIFVPIPASVEVASGNNQIGPPGMQLPQQIGARVLDAAGQPAAGVTVLFQVTSGGGVIADSIVVTNFEGVAEASWTLGAAGDQIVTATVLGLPSASFNASLSGPTGVARTWVGTSSDWSTAANWLPMGVPGALDDVTISGAVTSPIVGVASSVHSVTLLAGATLRVGAPLFVNGSVSLGASAVIDVYAPLRALAKGMQRGRGNPALSGGVLAAYSGSGPDLVLAGNGMITGVSGSSIVPTTYVNGFYTAGGTVTFGSDVVVEGVGLYSTGAGTTVVTGSFTTLDNGRLQMPGGILEVFSGTYFYGGSTSGMITAGNLILHSEFYQYGSDGGEVPDLRATAARSVRTRANPIARKGIADNRARLAAGRPDLAVSRRTARVSALRSQFEDAKRRGAARASARSGSRVLASTAGTSPMSFAASGTHTTTFVGACPDLEICENNVVVFFEAPGDSHFQNVSFANSYFELQSSVEVHGNMTGVSQASIFNSFGFVTTVFGTLTLPGTTYFTNGGLTIYNSPVGAGQISPDYLIAAGALTISMASTPGLNLYELDVLGNVTLTPGDVVDVENFVAIAGLGSLDINGATLNIYYGDLYTYDMGRMIQDEDASTVQVYGSATFEGGPSVLTKGLMELDGNLFQFDTFGNAASFAASGTHTVRFVSSAVVQFTNPLSSQFANLALTPFNSVTLLTDVNVGGSLIVDNSTGGAFVSGSGQTLKVNGINIPMSIYSTTFADVALSVGASAPIVAFNNVTFSGSGPLVDVLTFTRTSGSYGPFNNIFVLQSCALISGSFLRVVDSNGAGDGSPSFTFTTSHGSDLANCPTKVTTVGGASQSGFGPPS